MTWTRRGSTPASATSRSRPWAEWATTASKRRSSRRCAPAWPGRGSRGRTSCAVRTSGRPRGRSGASTCGRVSHWTWTTSASRAAPPVAEHVRDVLGQAHRPPRRRPGPPGRRRPAVEALLQDVAVRPRDRPVAEGRRDEAHRRAGPAQRGREGVVVGRRVRGRVDEVDPEGIPPGSRPPARVTRPGRAARRGCARRGCAAPPRRPRAPGSRSFLALASAWCSRWPSKRMSGTP